jgi:hypothetical protein
VKANAHALLGPRPVNQVVQDHVPSQKCAFLTKPAELYLQLKPVRALIYGPGVKGLGIQNAQCQLPMPLNPIGTSGNEETPHEAVSILAM